MGRGCVPVRILANQSKPESWKQLLYDQSSVVDPLHFGTEPDADQDPGIRTFLRATLAFLDPDLKL
jgi:hypothetical protein